MSEFSPSAFSPEVLQEAAAAMRGQDRVDVRLDETRGLALVSAISGAMKYILAAAGIADQARWSSVGTARGYVIPADALSQLRIYLETQPVRLEVEIGDVIDPVRDAEVDAGAPIPIALAPSEG